MGSLITLYTDKATTYLKERRDPEKPIVLTSHTRRRTLIDASERSPLGSAGGPYGDVCRSIRTTNLAASSTCSKSFT